MLQCPPHRKQRQTIGFMRKSRPVIEEVILHASAYYQGSEDGSQKQQSVQPITPASGPDRKDFNRRGDLVSSRSWGKRFGHQPEKIVSSSGEGKLAAATR